MANTSEVTAFARQKLNEHGLGHWVFGYDRATQRFGICRHGRKTITLSEKLVRANSFEQCCDTVLHEIAHALTPGAKHGPAWRVACRRIGAKPERCYSATDVVVVSKYRGFCASCGDQPIGARAQAPVAVLVCVKHNETIVWKDARGNDVGIAQKQFVLECDDCHKHLGTRSKNSSKLWRHTGCGGTVRVNYNPLAAARR